jgi:DNA-binding response OmpR family regulator
MLSSLAAGLREGGRFEVAVAPLTDPTAAQAAASDADAVALFYGAPAAVQALAARVRERGGRMVAVLQQDQVVHRDECFRAGASDLLFMPMPKEQFVARLARAVELSFDDAPGTPTRVSISARAATFELLDAKVTAAGVDAAADPRVAVGETVRLDLGGFQVWGLVARAGDRVQIRFAGLTPDEEGRIRRWMEQGATGAQPLGEGPPAAPAAPRDDVPLLTPPSTSPVTPPEIAVDRKAPRGSTRPLPPRGPPPIMTPPSVPPVRPAARLEDGAAPTPAVPISAPPASATAPNAAAPLTDLFGEGSEPEAPPPAPIPAGPSWPAAYSFGACKSAALMLLQDKTSVPEASPAIVTSARRITAGLGSAEREALQNAGSESAFADVLAARVALEAATADGAKLLSATRAVTVDASAFAATMKVADDAAARLQKEANAAVTGGEVETLQLVTATSSALSRDILAFKEIADRLRGLAAAPRLGAWSLDPHLEIPGHPSRPAAVGKPIEKQLRPELRDFQSLDEPRSGTWSRRLLVLGVIVFAILVANALYFSVPHPDVIAADAAGPNVQSIEVVQQDALVTVAPPWLQHPDVQLQKLLPILRERGVVRATLFFPNGRLAANLDVRTGKLSGMAAVPPAPKSD